MSWFIVSILLSFSSPAIAAAGSCTDKAACVHDVACGVGDCWRGFCEKGQCQAYWTCV